MEKQNFGEFAKKRGGGKIARNIAENRGTESALK
ncbi:MAG: hypothetical protein RLZZ601_2070 [Pseudomonadota bacterium]|jgi:hypothetical protein